MTNNKLKKIPSADEKKPIRLEILCRKVQSPFGHRQSLRAEEEEENSRVQWIISQVVFDDGVGRGW